MSRRRARGRGGAARLVLAAGCTAVATVGLVSGAFALWSANRSVTVPPFAVGAVTFAAAPEADAGTEPSWVYSTGGGAVEVTLPASEIVKVLDQSEVDDPAVVWRFTTRGQADGIAGLVYTVQVTEQVAKDGTKLPLISGVAGEDTLLHYSTLKVYPASVNGDCSAVPVTPQAPAGQTPRNVYLFDAVDRELQAAGAAAASVIPAQLTEQTWCVALDFTNDPDGTYVNEAYALGTGMDGRPARAIDVWQTAVAFPPSLPTLGDYYNRVFAWGTADDGTTSRAQDDWRARLYPDPANEPDVTITLDPAVTNQNPDITQPSDHYEARSSF